MEPSIQSSSLDESMEPPIKNPLLGVSMGSKVFASSVNQFKNSVLDKNVSQMVAQEASWKSMSGESSYVYKDHLNEGAFGISGAYGISGISQFKASLAAYAGHAVAQSSKAITVNYNAMSVAGIEYIDFENLTVGSFLESLNSSARTTCMIALDAYNKVIETAAQLKVDILTGLNNPEEYPELTASIDKWIKACNVFNGAFGDGLVVGVTWGACGAVQMTMNSETEDGSWQYGGEANFSYSGIATPVNVNVKTTYAGSNSSSDAKVNVTCNKFCSGAKLEDDINAWFNELAGKSYKELADVDVMAKAPALTIKDTPKIPPFEKPPVSDSVASRVDKIKDLDGLKAFAVASAYDAAKSKDKTLTLDKFINEAEEKSNITGLSEALEQIRDNDVDTLKQEQQPEVDFKKAEAQNLQAASALDSQEAAAMSSGAPATPEGYVPLGVWISSWSDIFPWLARGFENNIENMDTVASLRARVMLQDFQTLHNIYAIAHNSGITSLTGGDEVRTADIAKAFSNGAAKLQGLDADVNAIYKELGVEARTIYQVWNEKGFLRDCELGLGLIKGSKSVSTKKRPGGTSERQVYELKACSFNFADKDYTKFSQFYGLLPLITLEGDVWIFGPEQGGLSAIYDTEAVFSKPGKAKYLRFGFDTERKVLTSLEGKVTCYPIPFTAAIGDLEWKGMSVSTNVASCKSLQENLKQLQTRLSGLNAWTFSSQNWSSDWTAETPFKQQSIPKQYIGLIEEITTVI
ncbi:hypothetical protein [Pseudoalteromonas rubra]|uniref:Uncharacterized protein n=1 Tax=Pseudoalteromonas rubra TaxID=43658 RepID=A0A0U3G9R3_9GAMM|nr:hypothetical protein [Pseudoalteromonas rubra]ALU41482.1 hypothetical protein AT705_00195 [Pseudoalteromonas rubra]